jgi:hypothetical protein
MSPFLQLLRLAGVGALVLMLGACAQSYPSRSVSYKETALDRPVQPPGESELLSVRIEAFEPGKLPEDAEVAKGLSPEIRRAEAYYIPVQIKNTMQKSGHWGPVRVVPKGTREGEVIVTGTILESDGEILKLAVDVRDAAGVPWFSKEYQSVVDTAAYQKAEQGGVDAFQDVYNRIANDIAAHKATLKAEDRTALRQVAELRFGAEFAPAAYNGYLKREEKPQGMAALFPGGGRKPAYTVSRLPADDDPVVQRVNRIRAREELLVDTLDQQYDGLSRGVGESYTKWRMARLKEINALRESDRIQNSERAKGAAIGILGALVGVALASQSNSGCYGCTTAGVAVGAVAVAVGVQMAVKAYEQASSETQLHKAALEELGQSLAADVKPTVVEVEGKTVELKGTVEQKFQTWREVLQDLRDSENAPLAPVTPTS